MKDEKPSHTKKEVNGMRTTHNNKTKRGQLAGHVLLFILGLLIMGGILLIGYRAISSVRDQQCQSQSVDFSTSLSDAIDRNRGSGTSRVEQFTLPCGATEICFVSRAIVDDPSKAQLIVDQNPTLSLEVVKASIESGDGTNVFVRMSNGYEPVQGFSVSAPIDLGVDSNGDTKAATCIEGSDVNLRFDGKGRTVSVSQET